MVNIKKIIREEIENSWDWAGNIKPMKPEMLWLKDNFNNLTTITRNYWVYYIDSERNPLFYHNTDKKNNDYVYLNYSKIWSKLGKDFGLGRSQIQDVITEWLGQTYNLKGFTPSHFQSEAKIR